MTRIKLERDDIVLILWALTLVVIAYFSYLRGVEVAMQIEGIYQLACGEPENVYITPATIMTCEVLGCKCEIPQGVNAWIKSTR